MQRRHWFDTDFMNLTVLNDNDVTPADIQTFTYDNVGRLASRIACRSAAGARGSNAALSQGVPRQTIGALFKDGPSLYGYARQHPFHLTDFSGLAGDGTSGNNQAQNTQAAAVCSTLALNKDQRRLLHLEISGQNMCYAEILAAAKSMFCK